MLDILLLFRSTVILIAFVNALPPRLIVHRLKELRKAVRKRRGVRYQERDYDDAEILSSFADSLPQRR